MYTLSQVNVEHEVHVLKMTFSTAARGNMSIFFSGCAHVLQCLPRSRLYGALLAVAMGASQFTASLERRLVARSEWR